MRPAFLFGAFFLVAILAPGCAAPSRPSGPHLVRPADLIRSFRETPGIAIAAYAGQEVVVPTGGCRRSGSQLLWSLAASPDSPPCLILEFPGPAPEPGPGVWVAGTCHKPVHDDLAREMEGYSFHLRVTGCRPVPPPTPPGAPPTPPAP